MPLSTLHVEGKLDVQLLVPILPGIRVLRASGKRELHHRVRRDREDGGIESAYIRDRDFDFPPAARDELEVDRRQEKSSPLGWRWSRFAIESYMLEPAIVEHSLRWNPDDYAAALRDSASFLAAYAAARATVSALRVALPHAGEIPNRPEGLPKEFGLPTDLGESAGSDWVRSVAADVRSRVEKGFGGTTVQNEFGRRCAEFRRASTAVPEIVRRFPAKDLMVALAATNGCPKPSPGPLRDAIADWMIQYPDRVLDILPEWRDLREKVLA